MIDIKAAMEEYNEQNSTWYHMDQTKIESIWAIDKNQINKELNIALDKNNLH